MFSVRLRGFTSLSVLLVILCLVLTASVLPLATGVSKAQLFAAPALYGSPASVATLSGEESAPPRVATLSGEESTPPRVATLSGEESAPPKRG